MCDLNWSDDWLFFNLLHFFSWQGLRLWLHHVDFSHQFLPGFVFHILRLGRRLFELQKEIQTWTTSSKQNYNNDAHNHHQLGLSLTWVRWNISLLINFSRLRRNGGVTLAIKGNEVRMRVLNVKLDVNHSIKDDFYWHFKRFGIRLLF